MNSSFLDLHLSDESIINGTDDHGKEQHAEGTEIWIGNVS